MAAKSTLCLLALAALAAGQCTLSTKGKSYDISILQKRCAGIAWSWG